MIKKLLIAVSIAVMALTASNVFAITVGDPGFELGSYWSYNSGTNASSDRTNTFPPDGYASYTSAIADTYSAFMNVEQASGFAQVYQQFTTGFSEGDMVGLSGRVVQFDGEADQRWGQIKIEFYNGVDPISDFVSTEGFEGVNYVSGTYNYAAATTISFQKEVPATCDKVVIVFEVVTGGSPSGNASMLVDSVQAVPEPSTVGLFGIGLIGLVGAGVRKYRKKKI